MGSFLDICLPLGQSSCFGPSLVTRLRTLPVICTHTLAKMNLKVKASGRSKTHYGLELFSDFWLQGAFLCMCIVSLILYSERFFFFFALLCPWHDYSLKIFTRNVDIDIEVAQSCPTFCDPMDRLLCPWNFPGKNTGVGCHFLLQEVFPIQGSNPGLPHCKRILYHVSHQGSEVTESHQENTKM